MKKMVSLILVLCIMFSLSNFAFANEEGYEEKTFTYLKIPFPDDIKDNDKWKAIARYKDTKEPIALSTHYNGYIYATVPMENKDREIEAFIPERIVFKDYTLDTSSDFHTMQNLAEVGVIFGNENGEAKPFDNVTRAEAVAMIMRYLGLENVPKSDKSIRFKDVNKNDWFYPAITSAYNCKIVEGDSETEFSPNRNVTREEVVLMVTRALKYAGLNCPADNDIGYVYQDYSLISDWAKEAYDFLHHYSPYDYDYSETNGAIVNVYFNPQKEAIRKDVADVLDSVMRVCQLYPSDLAIEYGFDEIMPIIDGSTSTYPFTQAVYSNLFYNGHIHSQYPQKHSKSHISYQRLINGEVDMLFASVYPASDILKMAEEKGVELELIPIAYDAMIFFTNAENPATNLTKEQITNIYVNDAYENWSQIGGSDALLYPYCRNNDSGSHAQMEKHFLNGNEIHPEVQKETSMTMSNVLTDVMSAKTENPIGYGLGYSIYYYFHNMDAFYDTSKHLKLLSIDSIEPNDETIASGTYPLSNNTYVVLRKDTPKNSPARKLAEFMLTEAGQNCVEQAGFGRLRDESVLKYKRENLILKQHRLLC